MSDVTLEKQNSDLQTLLEITLAMQSEKDLTNLLSLIMEQTCRIMNADRATIFLIDEKSDELFSRVAKDAEISEIRFPKSMGIAGAAATNGDTINIPDAYEDERFNPAIDKQTGYRTKSILCMPLINNDNKKIGSVQVLNKFEGVFTDYDEKLLSSVAIQSAMALQNAMLIEEFVKKKEMQQALDIAADIQTSLLPDTPPKYDHIEFAATNIPCDETGGDYYDFIPGLDGDKLGVVIADASGHGIPAAMLVTTARAVLRTRAQIDRDLEKVMQAVNDTIDEDFADERFLTLFFGVLDPQTLEFSYSSGGHDSPQIFRGDDIFELESTGIPMGMMSDEDFPMVGPTTLQKDDIAVFCTDGIWEAMNEKDEEYGIDRLHDIIKSNKDKSAQDLIDLVLKSVEDFCGTAPQRDDLTMIIFKITGDPNGSDC